MTSMPAVGRNPIYERVSAQLRAVPKVWLITGVAGFIGSNLLEALLRLEQWVVGLDSYATGSPGNLEDVRASVGETAWRRFQFIEGDIANLETCRSACAGVDYVLHQAGLGSVPRSIEDPITSSQVNILGSVNMLVAARDRRVARFVYATSSSVYGTEAALPKREDRIGRPLSPYALTKYVNELYATLFAHLYETRCIGLRYFNVFGRRQDPAGAYAAVIPKWIGSLLHNMPCTINGDGETSRDFCYVANAVQANLLAAATNERAALNQVYNIAVGRQTTLNQLYALIRERIARVSPAVAKLPPVHGPLRPGDVRHSWADIGKAATLLGYAPTHSVERGLDSALEWYVGHLAERSYSLT